MARSKPSITGTTHTLPFDKLSPADFERLCLWLVKREGYERAEHLGAAGSEQGRDIVARRDGALWAFQCKRVRHFGPTKAVTEVEKVLALPEGQRPTGLVFLVTCNVSVKTRQAAEERCAEEMECHFWAGTELDEKVKRRGDIVQEFFDLPASGAGTVYGRGTGVGEALFEREVVTYTYRIRIAHPQEVKVEVRMPDGQLASESSGHFGYEGETQTRIQELQEAAAAGLESSEVEELGETLFDVLLAEALQRDFLDLYKRARREKGRLRIELDVDERHLPDVAALPWELMRVPSAAGYGATWLGTAPGLTLVRRRADWVAAEPIQLKSDERLRIALGLAAPSQGEVEPVEYGESWKHLQELANHQPEQIKLLGLVNPATTASIEAALQQEPHVFHFIGHARLANEGREAVAQIALVDEMGRPTWIDAAQFCELFHTNPPGVVVLQACETAGPLAAKALPSIASQLVQQNVPVVVAMDCGVSNATAGRFAPEFYRRLSKREPVDRVAQESRRFALGQAGYRARDFAAPALFMNVRDGCLFRRSAAVRRLPGLAPHYELNRKEQIAKLESILDTDGAGIMIWGHPNAGHAEFMDIAMEMMRMRGIKILDYIDADERDDIPDREFFISELEDILNIPRGVVIVSTDGSKKKRTLRSRMKAVAVALQSLVKQDSTALIFFALHKANEEILHWFWHKLWITYLEPLTAEGLWTLFISEDIKGTKWWSPSSVEPEFILLGDILEEDVSKFFIDQFGWDVSVAMIRAKGLHETVYPRIDPKQVYSKVESTVKHQRGSVHR